MRVLFVPMAEDGGAAHLIPLLALHRMLKDEAEIETAFLTPLKLHRYLRQMGINVIEIDNRGWMDGGFRTEMLAYGQFSPDVVVDDTNITTALTTSVAKRRRVTIQRTGSFEGSEPRNRNHRHSRGELSIKELPDVTFLGLAQPTSFSDLFKADARIIPGIPSVEVLPEALRDDPSYFFSGPLLIEDLLIAASYSRTPDDTHDLKRFSSFEPLQSFFDENRGRKIIYITFGTVAEASEQVFNCIRYLLDAGMAVVSSIQVQELSVAQRELYFYAHYLPMHFVCSNVDLMIHQCGSGTYHYPILHNVPTITIGTQCFDREDVALRLEDLGVSVHIPSPVECPQFVETFKRTIDSYFADDSRELLEKKKHLAALYQEVRETSAKFNFAQVLRSVTGLSR